ncbi:MULTISPECIES: cation:proton antiporter [Streptomyces]|uniref:cation:proton antiporter n=1 Tax=Streptomyces TaxID=1883 RepID=UPI0004C750C9|nr:MULTISPECIES: cation:proton antiporter [Streptomyces]RPK83860.1 High-affinity Na(+)/H(+) antiporter NhaS3 [Streptomyces sp. ADI98-10]
MTQTAAVVVPIPHDALTVLLLQIGVLLAAALLLGRLARRLGMPSIVGELTAGVLLGPSLLARVVPQAEQGLFPQDAAQMHLLDAVGQFGVVLLVGFTGMHLDLKLVRRQGRRAAVVSAAGLIVPLVLGVWLGFALPGELRAEGADPTVFALFVGVAMCVSAIPVIARTLLDMKLIHRNVGQMILVAGTVDDAVGWLLVSLITAMATTGLHTGEVTLALTRMAVLLVLTMTVGRYVVRAAMRAATRSGTPGRAVTTAVVLIMLSAAGAQALGLEAVFGAFLCGVLIGSSKDIDTAALHPLNITVIAVLAPLFFATAGLRMDLGALADPQVAVWGLAVFGIAVLGKFAGAYLGGTLSGMNRWESTALGAGMNARGVIEVIIAMIGVRIGLLTVEMYSVVVLVAVLTSLMAPPLLRMSMKRVEHTAEEEMRKLRLPSTGGSTADGKDPVALP